MIDEKARRKPGFTPGVGVVLADGQEWTFALPRLRVTPGRRVDGSGFHAELGRVGLADYPRWAAIIAGDDPVPNREYWDIRVAAGATLLLANYDLSDDELASLLVWVSADPASEERWDRIDDAILGVVPKAEPATSS
jgi:hypothetical protein